MTSREKMFACTLASPEGEYSVELRAWNANEAEARFRELLASEGVDVPGAIEVRPSAGEPSPGTPGRAQRPAAIVADLQDVAVQ